ncbi:MAG: hypothetical protein WB660_08015, partial [Candidatus Sulfotelmatobacter sp.]
LLDQVPVSVLCEEKGLQPTVFYRWQKEFFENGASAFQAKERPARQIEEKQKRIVDEIDTEIAGLNSERYSLNQNRKKILTSLEDDQILFNPDEAQQLFEEVGVLFKDQIKKDFQQLISFNKSITEERRAYLQEERVELEARLRTLNTDLSTLGKKRSDMLAFLSSTALLMFS